MSKPQKLGVNVRAARRERSRAAAQAWNAQRVSHAAHRIEVASNTVFGAAMIKAGLLDREAAIVNAALSQEQE